jgi:hypothetical protein
MLLSISNETNFLSLPPLLTDSLGLRNLPSAWLVLVIPGIGELAV